MPDKRYKRKDGKRCLRCWRNRLKHGNKLKKQKVKIHMLTKCCPERNYLRINGTVHSKTKYREKQFRKNDFVTRNQYKLKITPSKIYMKEENYPRCYDESYKQEYYKYKWKLDKSQKKINKLIRKKRIKS